MPIATVRGASIRYEVLGERGAWVALTPGGRNAMDSIRPLARRVADAGFRVLIHDRRNCGGSDVLLEGELAEHETWAEDLHDLLGELGALPAHVGGGSSGCRMSLALALRHPEAVRSLLLWRVTGGPFAAQRLAEKYYGEYIRAAQAGGMQAVCETEHFAACIAAQPANRDRLLAIDPQRFVAAMERWHAGFHRDADLPVIGASEAQLRSIEVPTCVIPGNDKTHPRAVGRSVRRFVPRAELHDLTKKDWDLDVSPPEEWEALEPGMAAVLAGFLRRMEPQERR
jgi:pimeloyl-ACP methyl ester carboxylesterase